MKDAIFAVLRRIRNEPVLVTATVIAVANVLGLEVAPELHDGITTVVVFVVGLVLRLFTSPADEIGF